MGAYGYNRALLDKMMANGFNFYEEMKKAKSKYPKAPALPPLGDDGIVRLPFNEGEIIVKDPVKDETRKNGTIKKGSSGLKIQSLDFEDTDTKYSTVSSWAWWEDDRYTPKEKDAKKEFFRDEELKKIKFHFNAHVVFLGVNAGAPAAVTEGQKPGDDHYIHLNTSISRPYGDFEMFHDTANERGNLWKALSLDDNGGPSQMAKLSGAYITDLFKLMPTADGKKLENVLTAVDGRNLNYRDIVVEATMNVLKQELEALTRGLPKKHKRKLIIVMQSGSEKVIEGGVVKQHHITMAKTDNFVANYLRTSFLGKGFKQGYITSDYELIECTGDDVGLKSRAEHTYLYDDEYVVSWIPHYVGFPNCFGTVRQRIRRALVTLNNACDKLLDL